MKKLLLIFCLTFVGIALGGPKYQAWASHNQLSGAEAIPNADPDGDGISNAVEFVIRGLPNRIQVGSNSSALLPAVKMELNNLVIVYRRGAASTEFPTNIQYSTDLLSWHNAANNVSGVVVTIEQGAFGDDDEDNAIDRITVKIPMSLSVGGKLFGRLMVNSN